MQAGGESVSTHPGVRHCAHHVPVGAPGPVQGIAAQVGAAGIERAVSYLTAELLQVFDGLWVGNRLPEEAFVPATPAPSQPAQHRRQAETERTGAYELDDQV